MRFSPPNAYSVSKMTAKSDADGSVTVQFGGCDGKTPNCLPIMTGWNYTVRLFRPRPEILGGLRASQRRVPASGDRSKPHSS
jgi:hypothetical protein